MDSFPCQRPNTCRGENDFPVAQHLQVIVEQRERRKSSTTSLGKNRKEAEPSFWYPTGPHGKRTDVASSEGFPIELEPRELEEAFSFRSKDGPYRTVFRGPCPKGLFLRPELRQVHRLAGKRAETALSGGLLS